MAAEWVEIGKEVLKLAVRARYSFSLWVVSLFILMVPLPDILHLDSFRQEYGKFIGPICLFMFVVWIVEVSLIGSEAIKTKLTKRHEEKKVLKNLDSLNSREAHLLVVAVSNKIQTVTWGKDADEVSSLVAKGLLLMVPDQSRMFHKPFTIPRFVWEEINKPKALEDLKEKDKEQKS